MAKATIFSDEINRLIESEDLDAAKKKLYQELLEAWEKKQREKIETAKKWLQEFDDDKIPPS